MIMQDIMDNCSPSQNVGILEIHGTQDYVTYYYGDEQNQDGWGAYPSIPATIDFFVDMYNLELNSTGNFPNSVTNDGSSVSFEKYGVDEECAKVWLYTVNGGGHDWPGAYGNMDIDASREAWLFFESLCESTIEVEQPMIMDHKKLEKVVDLLGRETQQVSHQILLHIYDDGSVEKKIILE
jgi:polyhydroxybutyrate depolymerase